MGRSIALRAARRAAGQCTECGAAAGGKALCEGCKAKRKGFSSYGRKYTEERRAEELLCIGCGEVTAAACSRCEGCKEVERVKSNARYAALRAAGTCIRCALRPAAKGEIRCGICDGVRARAKGEASEEAWLTREEREAAAA